MESSPPWGRHRPGLVFRLFLALSRAVPQLTGVKQLCFLFRRLARAAEHDPVDVRLWGHRLRLRARGNVSEGLFLFMPRGWDARERRFLARHLGDDAVFVDVGANAGGYLWWVLHLLGSRCSVVAVEPDPELRERLLFNLRENGIRNVAVYGVAVGPAEGEGRLRIDPDNRGQNVLLEAPRPGGPVAADGGDDPDGAGIEEPGAVLGVPVVPLPELLRDAGVEVVDALKIDVEGLEPAILSDFFERAPERLWPGVVVTERREGPEHRALEERLRDLGYRVEVTTRLNVGLRRAAP